MTTSPHRCNLLNLTTGRCISLKHCEMISRGVGQSLTNLVFQVSHLGSIYSALFHLLWFSISEEKRLLIPSTSLYSTLLRWKPLSSPAQIGKKTVTFLIVFCQNPPCARKNVHGLCNGESRTEEQQLEMADSEGHLKSMVLSPMSVSASSPASSPSMIAPSS